MQKRGWTFLRVDRIWKIEWTTFRSAVKSSRSSQGTDHRKAPGLAPADRLPAILSVTLPAIVLLNPARESETTNNRNTFPCSPAADAEIKSGSKCKKLSKAEDRFLSDAVDQGVVRKQTQRISTRELVAFKRNPTNFQNGTRFATREGDAWSACGPISTPKPRHLERNLRCVALPA